MALADFSAYRVALSSPSQVIDFAKIWTVPAAAGWSSSWIGTGFPGAGAVPSGAATIPDRSTVGSLGQFNPSGELRAHFGRCEQGAAGTTTGITLMLVDRLAHKGGLDGTSTGAQTVSTPALTRYTSGVGVIAAVEIYTAIGATGTTATMAYDGDSGAGHTSQPVVVGGAGFNSATRILPLSLQAGDAGVKAVTSITLAASTTTVGNFGVTLFKPLMLLHVGAGLEDFLATGDPISNTGLWMPKIETDACLQFMTMTAGSFSPVFAGTLNFFED